MAKNFLQSVAKNLKKQPRDVALQRERIQAYPTKFEDWMDYEDGHNKAYNDAASHADYAIEFNDRYINGDENFGDDIARCDDRFNNGASNYEAWTRCIDKARMRAILRAKIPTNEDIQLDPQMYIEHFDPVVRDRAKMFINGED